MNQINKVILFFILVVGLFTFGIWNFVQTEQFATFFSNRLSSLVQRKFNYQFSLKRMEFGLIGSGVILHEISLKKTSGNSNEEDVDLKIKRIEIDIDFINLALNELTLKKIAASDGVVVIRGIKNSNLIGSELLGQKLLAEKVNESINSVYEMLFSLPHKRVTEEKFPFKIKFLDMDKLKVNYNGHSFKIERLNLENRKHKSISGTISNAILNLSEIENKNIDGIKFDVHLAEKTIDIREFDIYDGLNIVNINGQLIKNGSKRNSKNSLWTSNLDFSIKSDLQYLLRYAKIPNSWIPNNGLLTSHGKITGNFEDPVFLINLNITGPSFDKLKLDELKVTIEINKGEVYCNNLKLKKSEQEIFLETPFKIHTIGRSGLKPENSQFILRNVQTNTALFFLDDILGPVKGELNGRVFLNYDKKTLSLSVDDDFKISKFKLVFDPVPEERAGNSSADKLEALKYESVIFDRSNLKVYLANNKVEVSAGFSINNSKIKASGWIENDELFFRGEGKNIILSEIGPIYSQEIDGKGDLELIFSGKNDKISMNIELLSDETKILDLNLGKVISRFVYDFKKETLSIKKLNGELPRSKYEMKGEIKFGKNSSIDIDASFPKTNYEDVAHAYKAYIPFGSLNTKRMVGDFDLYYSIGGGLELNDLKIQGSLRSGEMNIYGESIRSANFDFHFQNRKVKIDNIVIKKDIGQLTGELKFDTKKSELSYLARVEDIEFTSLDNYKKLGINFNGILRGESSGHGKLGHLHTDTRFSIEDSHVGEIKVPNSEVNLNQAGEVLNINSNLMGGVVSLESKVNLDKYVNRELKNSYLKAKFQIDDLPLLVDLISGNNSSDNSLKGSIAGQISSSFNPNNLKKLDLDFYLEEFYFLRKNINVDLFNNHGKGTIRNGEIKEWDFWANGDGGSIKSLAEGAIDKKFLLQLFVNIDSSILELLIPKISGSSGRLENKLTLKGNWENIELTALSKADEFSFNLLNLPGSFDKIQYKMSLDDDMITVENFSGNYGQGSFQFNGNIQLKLPHPKVKLFLTAKGANVPLFKKSSLSIDGKSMIEGEAPPYLMTGDVTILKGSVFDEIEDLGKNDKKLVAESNFLPKFERKSKQDLINFNVNFDIADGIFVKNGLMEMKLLGNGHLKGNINSPQIGGAFNLVPGTGKLFFKSYDFNLSKSTLYFSSAEEKVNPEIYISGSSKISDYEIYLNVYGKSDNFLVDLTSDPPLGQEDILSLLTLGFTGDVSKNITQNDRQSLTSVGIGSILFNRFKITEGLKSSLGLKVSLAPELTENEGSFLVGKGGTGQFNATSRFSTATKVRVEKKLTNKVEMSVSSTIGGSSSQKQEMNLIYLLNERASLEGVYEVKTGGSEENIPESLGMDLKLNWTFK